MIGQLPFNQKTVPGRVRVKFAQNGGHEKATKKPRKTTKKQRKRPEHCSSKQKRAKKKPRKSHEKVTSKNATSNEKSSELKRSVLGVQKGRFGGSKRTNAEFGFLTLTPRCLAVKKFLRITGAAGKHTFWCRRPRLSAQTSIARRVHKKLCVRDKSLHGGFCASGTRRTLTYSKQYA